MTRKAVDQPATPVPWRDRRFVIFATGNFINNLGEGAYNVLLPLYIYEVTGSLAIMSLLAAVAPFILLLSPLLGGMVDRWGSRVFVVPGLLIQLLGMVALNLTVASGSVATWQLFGLSVLVQIGGEMYLTGWIIGVSSMFPQHAVRSRVILSSLFVTSKVVGPLLVSVGIGLIGYVGLLWFNAGTFLAPIVVWLLGIHPPARHPVTDQKARRGMRRDLVEGWRIAYAEKRVWYLECTALSLYFVSGTGVFSFMVWYLRNHFEMSTSSVSTVQAIANIGGVIGSASIAARARVRPRGVLVLAAVVMTAALFLMTLSLSWVFVVCMVAFFMMRSATTSISAMSTVKYLPPEVLGRAEGMFNLMVGIPVLLAPLVIPLVQRGWGSTSVLVFLGVAASVSLLCLVRFWPRWPDADAPASVALVKGEAAAETSDSSG